ncbi:probable inactive shikimate kinase like 1, chloroplastic [Olea europaea var. sylvestris]|uniref:Probable inactive shikimate kinase like 1, chloroplastic isoform X1 n=1 Tax=Olea europaea subsp. europaea TaxID=158383 RepID=A0A8S0RUY2_OLEEU|nr:probable inactive shikimate kinase like 1, chloroplastic [Olea europaea var. sylvestris]CAA2982823.1 probable inactive shikimate kinase like 1, chloroplastic isoform X1 [Olea europaea subsp. europaea]
MEIIQASCGCRNYLQPRLNSRIFYSNSRNYSVNYYSRFHPRSIFSRNGFVLSAASPDSVATEVAQVDLSLAIKKRAAEISPNLKGTSIFLVGINSTFKSNLGKILADTLRYYYFDSDSLVEEAAGGKTAAISYIERDEEGFLASETEVLKQLSSMVRLVVCAGNGAVKDASNLALLRHGITIWIDVPLDLVAREIVEDRIQLSATDMLISGSSPEVLAQLNTLYECRRSGYATADATISIQKVASELGYNELNAVDAEDLCMEALKEIEKLMRAKKMMEEAAKPF